MRYGLKALLIGVVMLGLLIPILTLRGLVQERQVRAAEVRADIARASSRAQRLLGPLLLVHIEETVIERRQQVENGVERALAQAVTRSEWQLLAPVRLHMRNALRTETRRRGLFAANLYHDALTVTADFTPPLPPAPSAERPHWAIIGAAVVFGTGDNRGIGALDARFNGQPLQVDAGSGLAWWPQGVQMPLAAAALADDGWHVEASAQLRGSERLAFIPVGAESTVEIKADWPHPSFQGNYLPDAPEIDADGFSARWTVSRLSSQAHRLASACTPAQSTCAGLDASEFAVAFVDPVDRYLMTDRAMKFALLFLGLVFGAVFFIEVLKGAQVHPLQYMLTGLALAVFFLLLLALAEHIGFAFAYGLAAAACVGLIATYIAGVLGSRQSGLAFAGLLALLFALLYGLLQSEDYALLMGAVALFAGLATVMLLTRRLDWYAPATGRSGGGPGRG